MIRKLCVLCGLLIFPIFVTLSCAASVSEAEFLQRMDEADRFIASGDAKSALKILNRLNRGSYSAKQRLGIYRRYDALGEFSAAETCLKKGLKDIPESDELSAVYAWHLLERGRTGEAAEAAKKLSGTRFGQLAAEIRMRSGGGLAETSSPETTDRALLRLFVDAYNGTRNDAWLMNAATLYALDGDIPAAAALAPGIVTSTEQAMFWGRLLLDTDYPREASGYLDAAGRIFSYLDPYETDMEGRARLDALKADAFIRQGDTERASEIWNEMCARAHEFRIPDEIVATAFYNLSRYAKAENRAREWYENLVECLKRAPDELFALDAYADYSFNQAYSKSGDGLTEALRLSGLSSRGMSAYEEIPRVPFEDVAARLKAASGRSAEHYAAYLRFLLAAQEAADDSDTPLARGDYSPLKNKTGVSARRDDWLWDALEENYDSEAGYPAALARFASRYLFAKRKYDEAKSVLGLYFSKRYGADISSERVAGIIPRLASWECESLAWLSLDGDPALAVRLYEYLYDGEIDEPDPYAALKPSYEPPFEVVVNLAEMDIALGRKDRAEALYQQALAFETNPRFKAELVYRLADLQNSLGNTRQALLNLEYCLILAPEHRDARMLLKKLGR